MFLEELMSKFFFFTGTVGFAMIASTAAISGGFSRGGVDFNLLYSDKKIAGEAGFRFVAPQRTIDSATRLVNTTNLFGTTTAPITTTNNKVTGGFLCLKALLKSGLVIMVIVLVHFPRPLAQMWKMASTRHYLEI